MPLRLGLELTFVPDIKGDKEFTSERAAARAARSLQRAISGVNKILATKYGTVLIAKAERFRRKNPSSETFVAWIVEVNNGPAPTHADDWQKPGFVRLIQRVFNAARKLSLLPRIRRRGLHQPAGGSHVQISTCGIFNDDTLFLSRLAKWERDLYVDYSNRPYIRWLFAEWFDRDHNSRVIFNADSLSWCVRTTEFAYSEGLTNNSISRRFSDDGKPSYATYEHRYLDSPPNAKALALQIRFVLAWTYYHRNRVLGSHSLETHAPVEFTLNEAQFKGFRNLRHAWGEVSSFIKILGLNPRDYRCFFEDNYIPRMRHGEMT